MLDFTMQPTSNDVFNNVEDGTELFARNAGTGPVKLL